MPKKTSIKDLRELKVGDLVTHALYGKEWIGLIIGFEIVEDLDPVPKEKALVQIQPGTKYEFFFKDRVYGTAKVSDNMGYVSIHWLFKLTKQKRGDKK